MGINVMNANARQLSHSLFIGMKRGILLMGRGRSKIYFIGGQLNPYKFSLKNTSGKLLHKLSLSVIRSLNTSSISVVCVMYN